MTERDDFSVSTRRDLARRAGLRCANPDCGRETSAPSDDATGTSTLFGRGCHITAASPGGPRYDPSLSADERSHADNGIWLCAICADRVDKRENAPQYPVELLRVWKAFHESSTGTDHASLENRRRYPMRRLEMVDFAGVRGGHSILLGALTLVAGTTKLSHRIGELLRMFSAPEAFRQTYQPVSGDSWEHDRWALPDGRDLVLTIKMNSPRMFASQGKLSLTLSDGRCFTLTITNTGATLSLNDVPLPTFTPVIQTVPVGHSRDVRDGHGAGANEHPTVQIARYFGMSPRELKGSIEGLPSDRSVFGYDYRFDADGVLEARTAYDHPYLPVMSLSRGEKSRFAIDVAIRAASYAARVGPTVLLVADSTFGSLDSRGWAALFEWVEHTKPPFQTVIDLAGAPCDGDLNHALCYEVLGDDMEISGFELKTWSAFRRITRSQLEDFRTSEEMAKILDKLQDRSTYSDDDVHYRRGLVKDLLEEYAPLLTLVRGTPEAVSARLLPKSNEGPDAAINAHAGTLSVQITVADQSYQAALTREVLATEGSAFPATEKSRDRASGKVVQDGRVLTTREGRLREQVAEVMVAVKRKAKNFHEGTEILLVNTRISLDDSSIEYSWREDVRKQFQALEDVPYGRVFLANGDELISLR